MSQPENTPLQFDMFSGELVDNRTQRQKKHDREQEQPQQLEMFSQRDVAQFGVNAHPLFPLSPNTKLLLISEDPRTEEEKESDLQKAAEEKTYAMFDSSSESEPSQSMEQVDGIVPATRTLALVTRGIVALVVIEHLTRAIILFEPETFPVEATMAYTQKTSLPD